MGRTATAFVMLVAVGGCVADNQGPAAFQTAQTGQSPATASCYATWSKSDQFAALHDETPASPRQTAAMALNIPPMPLAATAANPNQLPAPKPLPTALTGNVVAPVGGSAPYTTAPYQASEPPAPPLAAPIIDPELVRTTMVQTPPDCPAMVQTLPDHPAMVQTPPALPNMVQTTPAMGETHGVKLQAKTASTAKAEPDADQASAPVVGDHSHGQHQTDHAQL